MDITPYILDTTSRHCYHVHLIDSYIMDGEKFLPESNVKKLQAFMHPLYPDSYESCRPSSSVSHRPEWDGPSPGPAVMEDVWGLGAGRASQTSPQALHPLPRLMAGNPHTEPQSLLGWDLPMQGM